MGAEYGELSDKVLPVFTQALLLDSYRNNYTSYLEYFNPRRLAPPNPEESRLLGRVDILEEVLRNMGLGGPMEIIKEIARRR